MIAANLHSVADIQIFCQGIGLPTASLLNRLPAKHACTAVEILKDSSGISAGLFDQEMYIDDMRDRSRQQAAFLIDERPARCSSTAKYGMLRSKKSSGGMKSASKMAM